MCERTHNKVSAEHWTEKSEFDSLISDLFAIKSPYGITLITVCTGPKVRGLLIVSGHMFKSVY